MSEGSAPAENTLPTSYRAGVVQLEVRTRHAADNRARAAALVARCAAEGCRLVALPEAFDTGLDLPRSRRLAQPIPGSGVDWLAALAREHQVTLAAGLLERAGPDVFSTAVLIDVQGELLARHRRSFVVEEERRFLATGEPGTVVATPLGRIGLLVGYEIHFPEVSRPLFAQDVDVLICCAQLLRPFADSIRILALARAAENTCHLVLASAAGENTLAKLVYLGRSMILRSVVGVRPYSDELRCRAPVLAEAGDAETAVWAEIALAEQRRLRAVDPLYRDLHRSRTGAGRAAAAGAGPPDRERTTRS